MELRLKRIKMETAVIEQHNKRLENKKENVLEGSIPDTVVDSEVSDVIKLKRHCFTFILSKSL